MKFCAVRSLKGIVLTKITWLTNWLTDWKTDKFKKITLSAMLTICTFITTFSTLIHLHLNHFNYRYFDKKMNEPFQRFFIYRNILWNKLVCTSFSLYFEILQKAINLCWNVIISRSRWVWIIYSFINGYAKGIFSLMMACQECILYNFFLSKFRMYSWLQARYRIIRNIKCILLFIAKSHHSYHICLLD